MYNQNYTQPSPAYQQPQYRPIFQTAPFAGLKGRPVASIDEVRGSIIDFDGSIFYFPDLANKRIYTKQINIDGTAQLCVYELKETPVESEPTSAQYVTREEFEAFIQSFKSPAVAAPPVPEQPVSRPPEQPLTLNF